MANLHYDVFISYRHGELDEYVAEKLHKMLENYRIPSVIAKRIGKNKLDRVFKDREELPTSSNLSDSINSALRNSDFLLLICSKRTCQSRWIMREIQTFGEMHGKDKIITLLIDGEPDESFPPGLCEREVNGETVFVEPLAADIRANRFGGSASKTHGKDWDRSIKPWPITSKRAAMLPVTSGSGTWPRETRYPGTNRGATTTGSGQMPWSMFLIFTIPLSTTKIKKRCFFRATGWMP